MPEVVVVKAVAKERRSRVAVGRRVELDAERMAVKVRVICRVVLILEMRRGRIGGRGLEGTLAKVQSLEGLRTSQPVTRRMSLATITTASHGGRMC